MRGVDLVVVGDDSLQYSPRIDSSVRNQQQLQSNLQQGKPRDDQVSTESDNMARTVTVRCCSCCTSRCRAKDRRSLPTQRTQTRTVLTSG